MKIQAAVLAVTAVVMLSGVSEATPPPCTNCSFPQRITIVGRDPTNGLAPDPAGEFTVTIRDMNNNAMSGVVVHMDFSACADVRLCEDQRAGTVVDCLGKRASVTTDELGRARFDVLGYAAGPTPAVGLGCGVITTTPEWLYVDNFRVAIYDLAGHNGLAVSDVSVAVGDLLNTNGDYFERSDYTGNHVLQANDIALLVGAVLRGRSAVGCSSLCP